MGEVTETLVDSNSYLFYKNNDILNNINAKINKILTQLIEIESPPKEDNGPLT